MGMGHPPTVVEIAEVTMPLPPVLMVPLVEGTRPRAITHLVIPVDPGVEGMEAVVVMDVVDTTIIIGISVL